MVQKLKICQIYPLRFVICSSILNCMYWQPVTVVNSFLFQYNFSLVVLRSYSLCPHMSPTKFCIIHSLWDIYVFSVVTRISKNIPWNISSDFVAAIYSCHLLLFKNDTGAVFSKFSSNFPNNILLSISYFAFCSRDLYLSMLGKPSQLL